MITTKLNEKDKEILQRIRDGKTCEEISRLVFMSVVSIKRRVKAMKDLYECKTLPELIYKTSKVDLTPVD